MYNLKTVMEQLIIRLFAIFLVASFLAVSPVALAEDSTTLQFWGVVGTWVAGLSTFSAVVVSLCLAYKQDKIRLRINSGIVSTSYDARRRLIEVVNNGNRPAKIISLMWQSGKRQTMHIPLNVFNSPPPFLNYGEVYYYTVHQDDFVKIVKQVMDAGWKREHIRQLKIRVAVSNGQVFVKGANTDIIKAILTYYESAGVK